MYGEIICIGKEYMCKGTYDVYGEIRDAQESQCVWGHAMCMVK